MEEKIIKSDDSFYVTEEEFNEFAQAKSYEDKLKILLAHSQKNKKRIEIRRKRKMEKTQKEVELEMVELNNQFSEFLHTKGISAKFKLAFSNMADSARKQHENDVKNLNEIKAKSAEENKDFVEFLHAKGIKAKFHVVVENIKRGAKEASANTAKQIAKAKANTGNVTVNKAKKEITAENLVEQFNLFLKENGLDSQYSVVITEEDN